MEIEIVCSPDDANRFNDVLHFVIKEGMGKDIALKAKGVGSTIFCNEDLNNIDFGINYTFTQLTK